MTKEILYSDYLYHVRPDESKIISYEQFDTYELLVTMDDGSKELYDMVLHVTRRILPKEQDIFTMGKDRYATEFGYRLTEKLRTSSLTLEELSDEADIPVPTLYVYLRGERVPNFYTTIRLAHALGCDITEFMRIPK